jgi:hypothetical protein
MTAQPPPQVPAHRDPAEDKGKNVTSVEYPSPLHQRPKLFIALVILLIAWLAAIVVMRLTTVHRDSMPVPQPISR